MDILEQYEKNIPQEPPQAPQWDPSDERSVFTRLVMRFSGGKIQNEQQANMVLVIVAVIILGVSFFILINAVRDNRPTPSGKIMTGPGDVSIPAPVIVQ